MIILKVYEGDEFLRDLGLKWPHVTVGRKFDNLLPLPGDEVLDEHAHIVGRGGCHFLRPAAEKAAVSVNGEPLAADEERAIEPGDEIELAGYRIEVTRADEDPDGRAAPVDSSAYFSTARVLKELQITERTLGHLVESGKVQVRHYHGSTVFDKDAILALRDQIQAHTTKKMDRFEESDATGLLSFTEVAAVLDVNATTLNDFVTRGVIRAFRADDQIKFRSEDVSSLLKARSVGDENALRPDHVIIDQVSAGAVLDEEGVEMEVDEDETEETAEEESPAGGGPAPAPAQAPRAGRPRSHAVLSFHYFRRMTPMRNFPFYVHGNLPVPLRIEPHFPGCLCVPPSVEVAPRANKAEFWVTPLSSGPCPAPLVNIVEGDRVVQEVETPFHCARLTLAWVLLLASPLWILLGLMADLAPPAGDEAPSALQAILSHTPGALSTGLGLFLLTFSLGVLLFFLTRPAEARPLQVKLTLHRGDENDRGEESL